MGTENQNPGNIKFIFSLISLLMMIPALVGGDNGYYRTLFIFLINRVIDMFYYSKNRNLGFRGWSLVNQWLGAIVCAVSFSSMVPDFAVLFSAYSSLVNIGMYLVAVSCVLNEMVSLIVMSIKERYAKEKIRSDMKGA